MELIGRPILHDFKQKHADAKSQIESWEAEVEEAKWATPHELKQRYPKASLPGNRLAIFDICKNKYRLLVKVNYKNGIVLVLKVGGHKEYDRWQIS